MGFDYSRGGLMAMTGIMVAVTTASTLLRFWSRGVTLRGSYGLDDWLALIAQVAFLVVTAVIITVVARYGAGARMTELPIEHSVKIVGLFWVGTFLWTVSQAATKLSVLALYARIFGFRRNNSMAWKFMLSVTVFYTVAWFVASIFLTIFECTPVIKSWDFRVSGHCINTDVFLLQGSITNLVNDFMILLIPLHEVQKLNMQLTRKILLGMVFLLGYSVSFLSVGRLVVQVVLSKQLSADFTYAVVPLAFFIVSESALTLVAISLPAMFSLFNRGRRLGFSAMFHSRDVIQVPSPSDGRSESYGQKRKKRYRWFSVTGSEFDTTLRSGFKGSVGSAQTSEESKTPPSLVSHSEGGASLDQIRMGRTYQVSYEQRE